VSVPDLPSREGNDDREVRLARPGSEVALPLDPLRFFRWLALLGVAALILGRFVAPALPGATVGLGRAVRAFEVTGGVLSQLFAVSVIFGLSTTLIGAANSTVPAWMRLAAMGVSGYAALVVLGGAATNDHAPETSVLIAAGLSGAFAIAASLASRAARVARLPALVVGIVGASAVVRSISGLAQVHAPASVAPSSLVALGRGSATAAGLLVALALALSLVYVGRASGSQEAQPEGSRGSLWSPATIAAIALAMICAWGAIKGGSADASAASVVLKRAADRFLVRPEPYFRPPIRMFLGFLTPLAAAALLSVRRLPTLAAALCLALVAADVTDAPLGAVTLVLASLGVLLIARSGHVLWSALVARPPAGSKVPEGDARHIDAGPSEH
jgi:hypothetical protein